MRIIAGTFRGRQLRTVRDLSVRPTTDRAKQTIFDILSTRIDFEGIHVLDLFAGSGSLGLEALSRGAGSAVFVDSSREVHKLLAGNIKNLGCDSQCTLYQTDTFRFLKTMNGKFDLVFADPPYKLERIGTLPRAIHDSGVSKDGTYVVMEHSRESPIDLPESMYEIIRKPFGQTTVLILKTLTRS
ncbi:MAG: 16S rRNA (guanine(966)-N(2))-methyltransferase RsmD [Bacteroidota bacterium]